MKTKASYLFFFVILITTLLFHSCSRESLELQDAQLFQSIVLSLSPQKELYLSDALVLLLQDQSLSEGKNYEVHLASPTGKYTWKKHLSVVEIGSRRSLIALDLLYPPEVEAESGEYEITLYSEDGQKVHLVSHYLPNTKVVQHLVDQYHQSSLSEVIDQFSFTKQVYDKDGVLVDEKESSEAELIIQRYFDRPSGILYVIRNRLI